MSEFFQNANTLQKFWKGLSEAIPHISNWHSENGTLCIRPDNPTQIFFREKNTVSLGNKFSTFIKGYAVSFWAGLDISNKTDKGEVSIYFDKASNNPAFIDSFNNHTVWSHSKHITVEEGCRFVYKNGTELSVNDWLNFINEPLLFLLEL